MPGRWFWGVTFVPYLYAFQKPETVGNEYIGPDYKVTINNQNTAEFCDPAIDAQMRAAARMQPINTQLANRRWARVDRALVDAAPWVPLYNPKSVELVSRRVGGFRFNPIYGTLLDQLWVR